METIKYEQMLVAMQAVDSRTGLGIPFTIRGIKANKLTKKAGEPFEYINARLSSNSKPVQKQALRKRKRFAYHDQHKTFNLVLPDGRVRKVHLRLITYFNGMRVKW